MYLQYGLTQISIGEKEVELPQDVITSLSKRGKKSNNFIFDETNNSIKIYCVKCKKYHKVYFYDIKEESWIDTDKFKRSKERGQEGRFYFGSDCKVASINNDKDIKDSVLKTKSKKIKTTMFLEEDLYKYIGIISACTNKSKTELINQIIRREQERNPITNHIPFSV